MTVLINGTTGITTPGLTNEGSQTISTGTANGVTYLNGSKVLTSGSALTFDGTNLGVGVTPSAWGSSYKALQVAGGASLMGTSTQAWMASNAYFDNTNWRFVNSGYANVFNQASDGSSAWLRSTASGTAGNIVTLAQAMTLDAGGNLLVRTTSQINGYTAVQVVGTGGTNDCYAVKNTNTTSLSAFACWNSSGAYVGGITFNNTNTSFPTSSDYRLKENVQPMMGALEKVSALKPCIYTWKIDGSEGQGFIAHELQAVVPDAVIGEKDAVNEDGSIKSQAIDTSFLIATLTAAIQEQQAIINAQQAALTALTARVTALEGN